jgi:primosomal protein N' (replication factor Y) (superfamily II helicase)
MATYVNVVIDGSAPYLDRFFTYKTPERLAAELRVGQYVRVPWGKKTRGAFVAEFVSELPPELADTEIKDVGDLLEARVVVDERSWRLVRWLRSFYFGTLPQAVRCIIPGPVLQGLRRGTKSRLIPDNDSFQVEEEGPPLTVDQQRVWDSLKNDLGAGRTFLLHGVTGSGKTEIYLRATASCIERGETALVLVPEVALTPQTQERYRKRFGPHVCILHSGLTGAQRREQWWRIAEGGAKVVVGTRSAVFAPLQKLGLIVLDEEHDSSYKQNSEIRYHARQVAAWLSQKTHATVLLGSATPCLESYTLAQQERYQLLNLPNRVSGRPLPQVTLLKGNGLPHQALQALAQCKERGEQAVILLNRRGYSNYLQCYHCGWVPECRSCSISLTYHQADRSVRCHYCGAHHPAPAQCEECQGTALEYPGRGTERLEQELQSRLPELRVFRLDRDTVKGRSSVFSKTFKAFRKGELDCLLGTQMVAKGLDFPNVTLVVVLEADTGLHLPDFRATERTFALLTQVAGRSGRGDAPGQVLLVCRKPESPVFQQVLSNQWDDFVAGEQSLRQAFRYPPYSRMLRILLSDEDPDRLEKTADKLAAWLESELRDSEVEVLGPAPCPLEKLQGRYRWHVLLRASRVQDLQVVVRKLVPSLDVGKTRLTYDPDPIELL